jgi:hypothetical protein
MRTGSRKYRHGEEDGGHGHVDGDDDEHPRLVIVDDRHDGQKAADIVQLRETR